METVVLGAAAAALLATAPAGAVDGKAVYDKAGAL